MLIKIDFKADTPLYEQLRLQIIEGIARGLLKGGDDLPSVRQLAGDLGINLHTVNKAYGLLKAGGFIQVHRQKGVMVSPAPGPGPTKAYLTLLKKQLRPLAVEAYCRGMQKQELHTIIAAVFKSLQKNTEE
jgi:GntR family transcriptional regulator